MYSLQLTDNDGPTRSEQVAQKAQKQDQAAAVVVGDDAVGDLHEESYAQVSRCKRNV